jgi:ferredoxin-NADP reductase
MVPDCLYYKELKELEQEINNYNYLPCFSREAEDNTTIRRGYVHSIYEEIIHKEKAPAYFYLCGWKNMVDEAKARILALGYDKKDIHLELYG